MEEHLIEVKTTKCVLFLTREEFIRGLKRGKAVRRQEMLQERLTKMAEEREINEQ